MLNNKLYIPAAAIGVIGAGILMTSTVSAHGFGQGDFTTRLAERFGLDESDVTDFMQELHEEHHAARGQVLDERLTQLVTDGKITEEQEQAILAKHEEMQGQFEESVDMTPDERREAMQAHHDEMKAWAEEQGIDLHTIMMGSEFGLHHGGRGGYWIKGD